MKKQIENINPNAVSLAGEFAVLSKLALYGYDANMTLGHTKSIDILISNPQTNKMFQLEVKTKLDSRKNEETKSKIFGRIAHSWIMSKKHEVIYREELWYCFVSIKKDIEEVKFFIVPSKIVASYVKTQHEHWLQTNKNHKDSDMREFRLGFEGEKYEIETPTIEQFENNWNFN